MTDEQKLTTGKVIDEIIKYSATASAFSAALIAPNILIAVDKPLASLYSHLDRRERDRQAMRIIYYMKSRGYLAGDYEHGLQLTAKSKCRLTKITYRERIIVQPAMWDGIWRVIIYDIPKKKSAARHGLAATLRSAGCFLLQKSTWITPFDCRDTIASIAAEYNVDEFVSYMEVIRLDNDVVLRRRFAKKYPLTNFSIDK
ncbi:MAG: hypothetical protein WBB39_04300 [Candidatus Saccharimonadales bacterium]